MMTRAVHTCFYRHTQSVINHLAVCGCALVRACDWGSRGAGGSPGRGELLRLSRLGELLLGETSLLLQLLVEEWEEALDTTKPGERQPCRTGRVHRNRVIIIIITDNDDKCMRKCVVYYSIIVHKSNNHTFC